MVLGQLLGHQLIEIRVVELLDARQSLSKPLLKTLAHALRD